MKRTPKYLDWASTANQLVTRELAMRGKTDMPLNVITKRLIGALHEAAHFVAAVHHKVPVFNVAIIGTSGSFPHLFPDSRGCWGETRACIDEPISYATFALAGTAFQAHLFGKRAQDRAAMGDFAEGLSVLAGEAIRLNVTDGADHVRDFAWQTHNDMFAFLENRWAMVERVAVVLLMFSDAKGILSRQKTGELYGCVRQGIPFRTSHYPRDTFNRLGQDVLQRADELLCIHDEATRLKTWKNMERQSGAMAKCALLDEMAGQA